MIFPVPENDDTTVPCTCTSCGRSGRGPPPTAGVGHSDGLANYDLNGPLPDGDAKHPHRGSYKAEV